MLVSIVLLLMALPITNALAISIKPIKPIVVDQEQPHAYDQLWLISGEPFWQEFMPTVKKNVKVELHVMQAYLGSSDLEFSIEKPLGNKLTSMSMPASSLPDYADWIAFDFPDVDLIPEETYYLVLQYDGIGEYAWSGIFGNSYQRGDSSMAHWDFCFRTFVDTVKNRDVSNIKSSFQTRLVERFPLLARLLSI